VILRAAHTTLATPLIAMAAQHSCFYTNLRRLSAELYSFVGPITAIPFMHVIIDPRTTNTIRYDTLYVSRCSMLK